ncbi:MAG: hypothetical protein ACTSW1_19405 [Candidatus Hodarchaeales archaeon]
MFELPNVYPFTEFPWKDAPKIIDKLEYLGEESTPYQISPGTGLCLSDTYYTLGFLTCLHSYGRVVNKRELWSLNPRLEPNKDKPYRFSLIEDASKILEELRGGDKTVKELDKKLTNLSEEEIANYLNFLVLISQNGKVVQIAKGWDATFNLVEW